MTLTPSTLKVGLRFSPRDLTRLKHIAARGIEEGIDVELFDKAAEATEHGEPLIVFCDDPDQAQRMAWGFQPWGIERPVIEELNG